MYSTNPPTTFTGGLVSSVVEVVEVVVVVAGMTLGSGPNPNFPSCPHTAGTHIANTSKQQIDRIPAASPPQATIARAARRRDSICACSLARQSGGAKSSL
jgi:hypothetical protein